MPDVCVTCAKKGGILKCQGCQNIFCRNDLNAHRNELDQQLEEFLSELSTFQQTSNEAGANLKSILACQIDTWETESIQKIKEAANDARQEVETMLVTNKEENAASIHEITEQIQQNRQQAEFDERDIIKWKERLNELKQIVSKPYISIDEKKTEPPFIKNIRVNEQDVFDGLFGDVYIAEEGQLAGHRFNLFGSHGEIRGKRKYNVGIHRLRFEIEHLDVHPWWFFGIISNSTPMQADSHKSSSAYGWVGHNEVYMNGQCSKDVNGYISDYLKGDIIELILDCDRQLIRMNNLRSKKSYDMIVDLIHCPFP